MRGRQGPDGVHVPCAHGALLHLGKGVDDGLVILAVCASPDIGRNTDLAPDTRSDRELPMADARRSANRGRLADQAPRKDVALVLDHDEQRQRIQLGDLRAGMSSWWGFAPARRSRGPGRELRSAVVSGHGTDRRRGGVARSVVRVCMRKAPRQRLGEPGGARGVLTREQGPALDYVGLPVDVA